MATDINIGVNQDRLKFQLLDRESRGVATISKAKIVFAISPSRQQPSQGTLVFLHGVGSNASRWEEFVEKTSLQNHWNIIRVDLRGHGGSESTQKATLEQHADDCVAILDQVGVEQAIFVGHSLGAHIAMMIAQRYPQRVRALVLVDPLVSEALTTEAKKKQRMRSVVRVLEGMARISNAMGFRRQLPHYSLRQHDQKAREMLAKGGEALEAFIKEYSSPLIDLGHIHTADYARDLLETSRKEPDVLQLSKPVLVIVASSGKFTQPPLMRQWVNRLPMGAMSMVNCVHWPFTECPEEIGKVLEDWIEQSVS